VAEAEPEADKEGTVGQQIGLGSAVGLVVGLLCWRGNHSAQVVSTFPDAFTFIALAVLTAVAIRSVLHRSQPRGRSASLQAGLTVATAAGVVFGAAVAGLGLIRFAHPAPPLLVFGFFTALGSASACGLLAAFFAAGSPREHSSRE
jgi:hypothetical protein